MKLFPPPPTLKMKLFMVSPVPKLLAVLTFLESLLPLKEALSEVPINEPLFRSFLCSLSVVLKEKIVLKPIDSGNLASDSLSAANDRIQVLESALFSAERTIAALKQENNSVKAQAPASDTASPSKKAKIDESASTATVEQSDELKVIKAELEALKQVSDKRLIELDAIFTENQRSKRELEHQHEQVRLLTA